MEGHVHVQAYAVWDVLYAEGGLVESSSAVIAAPDTLPDASIAWDLTSAGCGATGVDGRSGRLVSILVQYPSEASESVGEYGMDVQADTGLEGRLHWPSTA